MDDIRTNDDRVLSLRLDLYVDSRPVRGWLRTEHGTDEHFVGWLGFFEALTKLGDLPKSPEVPGLVGSRRREEHREEPGQ